MAEVEEQPPKEVQGIVGIGSLVEQKAIAYAINQLSVSWQSAGAFGGRVKDVLLRDGRCVTFFGWSGELGGVGTINVAGVFRIAQPLS
jgi:hypothetical protein